MGDECVEVILGLRGGPDGGVLAHLQNLLPSRRLEDRPMGHRGRLADEDRRLGPGTVRRLDCHAILLPIDAQRATATCSKSDAALAWYVTVSASVSPSAPVASCRSAAVTAPVCRLHVRCGRLPPSVPAHRRGCCAVTVPHCLQSVWALGRLPTAPKQAKSSSEAADRNRPPTRTPYPSTVFRKMTTRVWCGLAAIGAICFRLDKCAKQPAGMRRAVLTGALLRGRRSQPMRHDI